ncbi:MAG: hypothetical protein CM15mP93_05850 [Thiotrichaceae bacterium]|nr:MAG: hypothetical protein CM15mP93_05850 [Thiotrichaceae bacterium]
MLKKLLVNYIKMKKGNFKWYCTDYWSEKLFLDLKSITETYMNDIQGVLKGTLFSNKTSEHEKTIIIVSKPKRDTPLILN